MMQRIVERIKQVIAVLIAIVTAAYIIVGLIDMFIFEIDGVYLMDLYTGAVGVVFGIGVLISLVLFIFWLLFTHIIPIGAQGINGWPLRILENPPILLVLLGGWFLTLFIITFATYIFEGTPPLDFLGQIIDRIIQNIFDFFEGLFG